MRESVVNSFVRVLNPLGGAYMYIYIYVYRFFVVGPKGERNILKWVCLRRDFYLFRIYLFIDLFILFLHTCMFPVCCFRQRTYLAQGLVNETWITRVCSLNGFQLVIRLYGGHSSLFLRVWFLIFNTFFRCVYLYVLEWF